MATNKNIKLIFLFGCLVVLSSCNIVKLPHDKYRKVWYDIEFSSLNDNCSIDTYFYNKSKKKLNGKYCIKDRLGFICTEFTEGLFNGKYYLYENYEKFKKYKEKALIEEGSYRNGLLDGTTYKYFKKYVYDRGKLSYYTHKIEYKSGYVDGSFEVFEDGHLIQKTTYKNSVKNGYEYHFSKDKDTIDIVSYISDPTYKSVKKVADLKINFYSPMSKEMFGGLSKAYNHSIQGKIYSEKGSNYISDSYSHTKLIYLTECKSLYPEENENAFYFFTILGDGNPYYDLYLIYFVGKVMRVGYIHKDDL